MEFRMLESLHPVLHESFREIYFFRQSIRRRRRVWGREDIVCIFLTPLFEFVCLLRHQPTYRGFEKIKIVEYTHYQRTFPLQLLTCFFECLQCFNDTGHHRFQIGEEDIVDVWKTFNKFPRIYATYLNVVSYQITVDRHHSYLRSRTDTHSSREMIKPRS